MSDDGFMGYIKHIKKSAIKKNQKFEIKNEEPDMVRIEKLWKFRWKIESTEDFRHPIYLVMNTGDTEDVLNVIRRRLSIV